MQPAGTAITWHASAAGCGSAEYKFYIAASSSSFTAVQGYSTTATVAWQTAGLPAGVYRIRVLARVIGSSSAYDVYADSRYEIV
jgi:hypothetical protein